MFRHDASSCSVVSPYAAFSQLGTYLEVLVATEYLGCHGVRMPPAKQKGVRLLVLKVPHLQRLLWWVREHYITSKDVCVLRSHGPEQEMLGYSINGLLVQCLILLLQATRQKVLLGKYSYKESAMSPMVNVSEP